MIIHGDHFGRRVKPQLGVLVEQRLDGVGQTHDGDFDLVLGGRLSSALHDFSGGVVAAHAIDRDANRHRSG